MRAVVQDRYGPYREVLHAREIPEPTPGAGEVVVRVRATSVHADVWHAVNGIPYVLRLMGSGISAPKKQQVPGTDLAGEVVRVGAGASRFTPGDRVFGEITPSTQWEQRRRLRRVRGCVRDAARAHSGAPVVRGGGAVPTAALIALVNLRDQGRIHEGQRVLVNGAGGAVGVWAVQLAKVFGAEVTAVDVPAKLDLLADLGADHVVDGTHQDFTRLGARFDIVFDVVSQAKFAEVRRALQPDGTYVLIGHDQYGRSGHRVLGSLGRMLPLMALSPFVKQLPGIQSGPPREENWATIVDLLQARRIRPVVDERRFSVEQAADAIDYLTTGAAKGRVVLTVRSPASPHAPCLGRCPIAQGRATRVAADPPVVPQVDGASASGEPAQQPAAGSQGGPGQHDDHGRGLVEPERARRATARPSPRG